MGAYVHFQSTHGCVKLTTILAGVLFLLLIAFGGWAMELLMLRQSHRGGVHFVAFVTLETIVLVVLGRAGGIATG